MSSQRTLKDIIEAAGYQTRPYSGRGMYGKECLSVGLYDISALAFYADLLENADRSHRKTITNAMRDGRTDSLGLGIILYFPNIEA